MSRAVTDKIIIDYYIKNGLYKRYTGTGYYIYKYYNNINTNIPKIKRDYIRCNNYNRSRNRNKNNY